MGKVAVFASGSGSNFEAIMQAFHNHKEVKPALLVCDQPEAYAIQRSEKWQVPAFVCSPKLYASKQEYEEAILRQLEEKQIEYIVLAGYMRLIGPTLLKAYRNRIINIHPSLLPAFPGKDAIGQAFASGVRVTGVTVHFVDEGMDTGPIIAQEALAIEIDDTKDTLTKKIQEVEHRLYPRVIEAFVLRLIHVEEGKVIWETA
ncbi:phosphoribosylglycinamide formyltransferase [Bacillus horti]|uniref:Phosphoribosylglycinamide formyltransferase n=1 Tax=Caldalkalibacillus horti TaxID=77523 RepID=A0ABT9W300_9BACI|nr:phosphoribosylglycinamide formyltransferase [Bacillus horti]MDQ0167220.1 phosphoribosylglycinamide formyltransferase-1 [Bacillus horti]